MKWILFSILIISFNAIYGSAPEGLFGKFPNRVFIETGTGFGDGVQLALKAGFQDVYSIESNRIFYRHSTHRFANIPYVHVIYASNKNVMRKIIQPFSEPITFWLDAHYCGIAQVSEESVSIVDQLKVIHEHPIKTHTIILDDVSLMGTWVYDYITYDEIKDMILKINPNYEFRFEDGTRPDDILVAYVPSQPKKHTKRKISKYDLPS